MKESCHIEKLRHDEGFSIRSMEERASLLGEEFKVQSAPAKEQQSMQGCYLHPIASGFRIPGRIDLTDRDIGGLALEVEVCARSRLTR